MQAYQQIDAPKSSGAIISLDARAKIAISVLASLMTIALGAPESQLVLFIFSSAYALGARRPWMLAAGYAIIAGLLLFALCFAWLIRLAAPAMPPVGVGSMLVPFLRLAVMINVLFPLAFTVRLQSLLGSLKSLHLPFLLYIPLAVMIRFIPTFIVDIKLITEALRIRGYALNWKQFVLHPFLSWRFIAAPLLFRALKTSEDLGIAAELKGLGAEREFSAYRSPCWKTRDTYALCIALSVAALSVISFFVFDTGVRGMH